MISTKNITKIYLVRHGETNWNLEGRLQGQLNIPLNQKGCLQAHCVADYLQAVNFQKVFSSSLIRAKTTAEIIRGDLSEAEILCRTEGNTWPSPFEIELLPALQEVSHGDWEGRLESELRLLYPHQFHLWKTAPLTCRKPNGENLHQVQARVIPAWENLVQRCQESQNVLVVAHKFTIQVILCYISGLNLQHILNFPQDNCGINIIAYHNKIPQLEATNLNVLKSFSLAA